MTSTSLKQDIESVSKIATTASKFGIFVGGACVVAYSLRINHFPQDLSLGDGLLFLMAVACFGLLYVIFIISLVALGIMMSPVARLAIKFYVWGTSLFSKRKVKQIHMLAPFEWPAVLVALFSIVIMVALGRRDHAAYWNLPLLSVALYVFYSIYVSCGNKIRKIGMVAGSALDTDEKKNIAQFGEPETLRKLQLVSLAVIFVVPLALGGVSGQLLDAAMRAAHVRIEKPVLYVKEPYSSLLPKSGISTNQNTLKDYTEFDKAVVLFKGFGKTTVISFQDGNLIRQLEIPNDQMIIESRY